MMLKTMNGLAPDYRYLQSLFSQRHSVYNLRDSECLKNAVSVNNFTGKQIIKKIADISDSHMAIM